MDDYNEGDSVHKAASGLSQDPSPCEGLVGETASHSWSVARGRGQQEGGESNWCYSKTTKCTQAPVRHLHRVVGMARQLWRAEHTHRLDIRTGGTLQ